MKCNSNPYVGLEVCLPAFQKAPSDMRKRLAERTNGETRLLGGSSDTVYIPGRHREKFMHVLGLFLETECFLEIAVPTTLHLVAPREETILYVDHVRAQNTRDEPQLSLLHSGGYGNRLLTARLCDRSGNRAMRWIPSTPSTGATTTSRESLKGTPALLLMCACYSRSLL